MGFIPTDEHDNPQGDWIDKPGTYKLRIKSITDEVSKSGGNPMKVLILVDTESGAAIRDRLVETEKAFWKIVTFAKSCGVQINRGDELDVDQSWVGKTCEAEIEIEHGETRELAKVEKYLPAVDSLFREESDVADTKEGPTPKEPETEEPETEEESF